MPSVAKQGIDLLFHKVGHRGVIPCAADAVGDLGPEGSSLSLIGVSFFLVVLFSGETGRWSVELLDCLVGGCNLYLFFFVLRTFRVKVLFVFHHLSLGRLLGYLVDLVLSGLVCVNLLFSWGYIVLWGTYLLLFL